MIAESAGAADRRSGGVLHDPWRRSLRTFGRTLEFTATILLFTHDAGFAARSDCVYVLRDGAQVRKLARGYG